QRTVDEQREIAKKGGIASGEARRKKKSFRETLEQLIVMEDDTGATNQEAVCMGLIKKAMKGDVKAYILLRDTLENAPVPSWW
ncbi:MAG: hypothetical protein IKQ99_03030, partial [Alphaproteobacteria bacterium]|nr:hypothetical protein [Alphaproteobacteria bacterium]